MCQKAVGSVFWPFFKVHLPDLEWTRGRPALYRSSEVGERGFCAECGTPLTFWHVNVETIDLSIGSLDDPTRLEPIRQHWAGARMPWFNRLAGLPEVKSSASPEEILRRRPFQHPDHDTSEWSTPGNLR
ncbi:GFA family protein [Mesorhizobium sp. RIZ17]